MLRWCWCGYMKRGSKRHRHVSEEVGPSDEGKGHTYILQQSSHLSDSLPVHRSLGVSLAAVSGALAGAGAGAVGLAEPYAYSLAQPFFISGGLPVSPKQGAMNLGGGGGGRGKVKRREGIDAR